MRIADFSCEVNMSSAGRALSCITPPHILEKLLDSDDSDIRQAALNTLLTTARLRGERSIRASLAPSAAPPNGRAGQVGGRVGIDRRLDQPGVRRVRLDPSVLPRGL